jgi:hypothetical protein
MCMSIHDFIEFYPVIFRSRNSGQCHPNRRTSFRCQSMSLISEFEETLAYLSELFHLLSLSTIILGQYNTCIVT